MVKKEGGGEGRVESQKDGNPNFVTNNGGNRFSNLIAGSR